MKVNKILNEAPYRFSTQLTPDERKQGEARLRVQQMQQRMADKRAMGDDDWGDDDWGDDDDTPTNVRHMGGSHGSLKDTPEEIEKRKAHRKAQQNQRTQADASARRQRVKQRRGRGDKPQDVRDRLRTSMSKEDTLLSKVLDNGWKSIKWTKEPAENSILGLVKRGVVDDEIFDIIDEIDDPSRFRFFKKRGSGFNHRRLSAPAWKDRL